VRLSCTLLSVVLLGLWINILTNRLTNGDYLAAFSTLGWNNLLLVGGSVTLITSELVVRRRRVMERHDYERHLEVLRQRQQRLLVSTLGVVCTLISKTLRVPCNGRYFVAVSGDNGAVYLAQDREMAILNVRMPREFGFTRVAVDTPHIVIGRAFRERSPIYEDLPVDHHSLYDTRLAQMIEPKQRWVLACPVLALDRETNRHDEANLPHGVICFYGVEDPSRGGKETRVETCLEYAEQFADQMSQLLSILDLTKWMAATHDHDPETVP
jgi:hypothetical protein